MKKQMTTLMLALCLAMPATSHALPGVSVEAAVGGWMQMPAGHFSYNEISAFDRIDLDKDLNFDTETRITGRLKVELPIVPNIYAVAAPMEFEGVGTKSMTFRFGDYYFTQGSELTSKLTLNQYDVALYYSVPLLKTATLDTLNIDFGLNARLMDAKAYVRGNATNSLGQPAGVVEVTKSTFAPIPTLYLALQFSPVERFSLEVEGRGLSVGGNTVVSVIGRVKVKALGPVFAAGGYRYDLIDIDEDSVIVDTTFGGPFLEAGFQF